MRYLRSMVLAGLALVACVMFSVTSMAASPIDPGLHTVFVDHFDHAVIEVVVTAPDHQTIFDETIAATRDKQRGARALMPVYLVSFRTDGRSLHAYHRRC